MGQPQAWHRGRHTILMPTHMPLQKPTQNLVGEDTQESTEPQAQIPPSFPKAPRTSQDSETTLNGLELLEPRLRTPGQDRDRELVSSSQNHPLGVQPGPHW